MFVVEDNNRATCSSIRDREGSGEMEVRDRLKSMSKVMYYSYEAKYPHVGTGKYVQF